MSTSEKKLIFLPQIFTSAPILSAIEMIFIKVIIDLILK